MSRKRKETADSSSQSAGSKTSASLFGNVKVDPELASLFADSNLPPAKKARAQGPVSKNGAKRTSIPAEGNNDSAHEDSSSQSEASSGVSGSDSENEGQSSGSNEETLSTPEPASERRAKKEKDAAGHGEKQTSSDLPVPVQSRRKSKRDDDDLESKYMEKLAAEEAREEARRRKEPRAGSLDRKPSHVNSTDEARADEDDNAEKESDDDDQIPVHESIADAQGAEVEKANRTVFCGNVSSEAITSKSARKTFEQHMSSILTTISKEDKAHKIESLRFRSTAYTGQLPKKASFITKDLMEQTTVNTNAYVVYSSKSAARAALKLNGTVVLDRHLRVDSVAHPAKADHKRCIFVGNLGFVDDESGIQAADEDAGKKKRKPRSPMDIEEGLWREFGKCGSVENVRVVRDSKTRVGKGIAYVQFLDENSVEAALLLDGKRFPPMLPRNLRVSRATAQKRNAALKKEAQQHVRSNGIYNPKLSNEQRSAQGRASRMLGKAGAAFASLNGNPNLARLPLDRVRKPQETFKKPEDFVFEGHRAKAGSHTASKKKDGKKGGRPKTRRTERSSGWRGK